MNTANLRTITNSFLDVRLMSLASWSKAKEIEPRAPQGDVEGLIGQLEEELEAKGYFHPPSRTQATKNTIRTIFSKTGWSSREVKAIRGIIRALVSPARRRG